MNTNDGTLSYQAVINTTDFDASAREMENRIRGVSSTVQSEGGKMDSTFSTLAKYAAGFFSIQAAGQFVHQLVNVRGEFQQLQIAFTTMLQSKGKADALMQQVIQTAATTPFNLTEVAQGAKQLLAYGTSADKVNDTLVRLGNIASGLSIPLNDLVYLYGTTQVQGRLFTQDVRQFMGRGIPLVQELANQMGKTTDEINDMVTAGKIGFPEVQKVIEGLTNKGGDFYNLMAQQSQSLTGQVSNLGDSFVQMFNKIGQSNEGILSGGISVLSELVANYETVGKVIAALIGTYGTYKAAVIAANVIETAGAAITAIKTESVIGLTTAEAARILVTRQLTAAQALLNETVLANPYVLAATAVAGLALAMWALHDSTTAEQKAQKAVNDELDALSKKIDDVKSKTQQALGVINSESSSRFQQVEAYKILQAMYPELLKNMSLETFQKQESTKAQKDFNAAQDQMKMEGVIQDYNNAQSALSDLKDKLKELQATNFEVRGVHQNESAIIAVNEQIDVAQKKVDQLKSKVDELRQEEWEANTPVQQKIAYYQNAIDRLKDERSELEKTLGLTNQVGESLSAWQGFINRVTLQGLNNQINDFQAKILSYGASGTGAAAAVQNKAYYEKLAKDAQDALDVLPKSAKGSAEWEAQAKKINEAKKALEAYNVTAKATSETEIFPTGSVAEFDRQIQNAKDALSKLNPDIQPDKVKGLQDTILQLTQARADAEKKIEVLSFQEQLDEKKKQYQQYENYLLKFGAEISNAQFSDLLKKGKSFIDYLQFQLAPLDAKISAGVASKADINNASTLLDAISVARGEKSPIDKFQEDLDKLKSSSTSITDYINNIKQREESLIGDTSDLAIQKLNILQAKETEALNDRVNLLRQFLVQVRDSESERLRITSYYTDLRQQVEASASGDKAKLLAQINDQEKRAQEELLNAQIRNTKEFQQLNKEILGTGRAALEQDLKEQQAALARAFVDSGFDLNNQEYIKAFNRAEASKQRLANFDIEKWQDWAQLVMQAGGELSQLPGALGEIGQVMQVLNQGAQQFEDAWKKANDVSRASSKQIGDAIASGLVALSTWVNIIASSINERKTQEEAYYTSLLDYQHEYNLALIDQIRLQTEASQNIFTEDYFNEIRDGFSAMAKATQEYNAALKDVADGQVKAGQRNKVNWSAVGSGALSGAAAGASIGTVVPIVGNAVGAVVGGLVGGLIGLFGGMKKADVYKNLLEAYPDLINSQNELNKAQAQALIDSGLLDDKTKSSLQTLLDLQKAIDDARQQIEDVVKNLTGDLGGSLRDALVGAFEDGTDAAKAFGDSVQNVLQNALSNIIFSNVFDQAFTDLQNRLEQSASGSGDGDWIDDFADFFGKSGDLIQQFNDQLIAARDEAKQYGLDIFGPTDSTTSNNSLSGAIKGITEQTANVLEGQINAIRINQAESLGIVRQQLSRLSVIASNTAYLISIDRRLAAMSGDQLRANGLGNGQYLQL